MCLWAVSTFHIGCDQAYQVVVAGVWAVDLPALQPAPHIGRVQADAALHGPLASGLSYWWVYHVGALVEFFTNAPIAELCTSATSSGNSLFAT
jgi:hypothetical protein